MAVKSDGRAYSQVVNAQVNPNLTKDYNDWSNMGNAVDHSSVLAERQYKRKGKKGNYSYVTPWVVIIVSWMKKNTHELGDVIEEI